MNGSARPNRRWVARLGTRLRQGPRRRDGFTLIELLVVIIIIAVLSSIAIPTFLGQRTHAKDAAAYTLVRNALSAMQGAFVDTGDYRKITQADLEAMEPSIRWVVSYADLVSTTPAWISDTVGAEAVANQVSFFAESSSVADLASISDSGNAFGVQIDSVSLDETGYVKVRVVDGTAGLGW